MTIYFHFSRKTKRGYAWTYPPLMMMLSFQPEQAFGDAAPLFLLSQCTTLHVDAYYLQLLVNRQGVVRIVVDKLVLCTG